MNIGKTKGMKAALTAAVLALLTGIALSFLPVHGEEKIYGDLVRLHVIANSDSEEDQARKLAVRDAVLGVVSSFPAPKDKEEAEAAIVSGEGQIVRAAKETLSSLGSDDPVRVEFGKESYPVRYYENYTLPAGEYTSLRVIIGEGEGKNWWCVLFPPLCSGASEKDAEQDFLEVGFTGEQYRLIKKETEPKYKVRFKILEILSDVFGFEY